MSRSCPFPAPGGNDAKDLRARLSSRHGRANGRSHMRSGHSRIEARKALLNLVALGVAQAKMTMRGVR
jgi:hypothetical protein